MHRSLAVLVAVLVTVLSFSACTSPPSSGVASSDARARALSGTVTLGDGSPLVGGKIIATDGNFQRTATTDAHGGYALVVPTGTYSLDVVYRDGAFATDGRSVGTVKVQSSFTIHDVRVPTFAWSALVVDGANNPVPGVAFAATAIAQSSCCQGHDTIAATTDGNGRLSVRLPANRYTSLLLTPSGGNYAVTMLPNQAIAAAGMQTFVIARAIQLSGHVTLGDGSPLGNATVMAVQGNTTAGTATSDASGAYVLVVAPGSYTLDVAYTDGGFSTQGRTVAQDVVVAGHATRDLQVPTFAFSGAVVDGAQKPVANATFSGVAFAVNACCGGFDSIRAVTDSAGHFNVRLPAASYLNLELDPAAGSSYIKTPLPNETLSAGAAPQTFVIGQGVALTGHVSRGDGSPLVGATVNASNGPSQTTAATDGSGSYALSVVPGTYALDVAYTDGGFATQGRNVISNLVVSSDTIVDLPLPTFVLQGTIIDDAQQPVAGVQYRAVAFAQNQSLGGFDTIKVTSAANGDYSVRILGGCFLDRSLVPSSPYITTPLADEVLSAATSEELVVASPVQIAGVVTGGDGSLLGGASVIATLGQVHTTATADAAGAYDLAVAPGSYTLDVAYMDPSFSTSGRTVKSNVTVQSDSEQDLQLPTFVVTGQVVDGAQKPVAGVVYSTVAFAQNGCCGGFDSVRVTSDANGQLNVRLLANSYLAPTLTPPPGPYVLTVLPDTQLPPSTPWTLVVAE